MPQPGPVQRLGQLELFGMLLTFTGCLPCYPFWPAVPFLLTAFLLVRMMRVRKTNFLQKLSWIEVLRIGVAIALFTLTWYLCASVSRQAYRGLGERIEAKGGSTKLLAWAADTIATYERRQKALPSTAATIVGLSATPSGPIFGSAAIVAGKVAENSAFLQGDEIPQWVDDIMGRNQGVRGVMVNTEPAGDSYVSLYTGGSAFHFHIRIYPSRKERDPPRLSFVENPGNWRPGIYLDTQGK